MINAFRMDFKGLLGIRAYATTINGKLQRELRISSSRPQPNACGGWAAIFAGNHDPVHAYILPKINISPEAKAMDFSPPFL
jgi:hypothetical protein